MPSWIIFVNHGNLFLSKLLKIRFVAVYARWRFSRAVGALFILFAQPPETWKNSGKTGKSPSDEKKIAKPLFCRYSAPAFLSSTISNGQVSEWSNEHAWKVCVPQTGTEGSNPSLSAINFLSQYIRDEYIAVFVCRGYGEEMGKILKSRIDYFDTSPSIFYNTHYYICLKPQMSPRWLNCWPMNFLVFSNGPNTAQWMKITHAFVRIYINSKLIQQMSFFHIKTRTPLNGFIYLQI